ncbi:MAG: phospho-N-acetylmuramoyl-pentapeptide-transferase [bacterium]
MLYHLFYPLHEQYSAFNVFKYLTFRMAYATLTALVICFVFAPRMIAMLQKFKVGDSVRDFVPQSGGDKTQTPTMGGSIILLATLVPTVLWAKLTNPYVWLVVFVTVSLGYVGFIDDYQKVIQGNPDGLSSRHKLTAQAVTGLVVGIVLILATGQARATRLSVPFFKNVQPVLGVFPFLLLAVIVVAGSSNAVNLTDGLDGLAIGPMIVAALTFLLLTYLAGNIIFARYLNIPYIKGCGELTIFCGAMLGASLGFLWFNSFPAQVFMGDMGALSLGGALGTIALIIRQELLLIIVGGVFVMEALSVIVQVLSFKATGRRVFKMAPIHHHFEIKGWAEPKIIVRFWIIAIILALIGLSTLKLR